MCGIAGILKYSGSASGGVNKTELVAMANSMIPRGPDSAGLWIDSKNNVGMAHRRLSIIDLSNSGNQPMASADNRYYIVFNGEIYNHHELRLSLKKDGFQFRSESDTEVLLALYAIHGSKMVHHLRGMFAFAIWDKNLNTLFLARDPFGIKPLYYSTNQKEFRFSSQVKSLLAGGGIDTNPEPAGYVGYFLMGSIPEPFTLYKGISSMAAGSTLTVNTVGQIKEAKYWTLAKFISDIESRPSSDFGSFEEITNESVRLHLTSDVPVGLFLSGGIDSAILGMAATKLQKINAVTLGFQDFIGGINDEIPIANKTAKLLGLDHQIQYVDKNNFGEHEDYFFRQMDQPSVDGLNTYFVSLLAKRYGLKVALSGVGADEWLAGYPGFSEIPKIAMLPNINKLGAYIRTLVHAGIPGNISPKWASLLEYGGSIVGGYLLRRGLYFPWELNGLLDNEFLKAGIRDLQIFDRMAKSIEEIKSPRLKISALELDWYMKNQLLRDADWAGMAHSVEIRTPFVDLEFAKKILSLICTGKGYSKTDLRIDNRGKLPIDVIKKKKTGFSVPLHEWMMGNQRSNQLNGYGIRPWADYVIRIFAKNHPEIWHENQFKKTG
jgi:asparagine synthase (glutamine-hydrolysing)